jgi:phage-related protein
VEPGLLELRGHQIRIFYVFRSGRRVIVLDAEVKKQDKIPQDVLKRVRARQHDLEAQEAEAKRAQGAHAKRRKR